MQCEIRAMSETTNSCSRSRTSDTLPKPGRVTEACKEWTVHEDGALAYRLQKEEVDQHYTGNKSRNAIVREDFPRAKHEQEKEKEEAIASYQQMVTEQELRDAEVARELALRIEREEEERRLRLERHDNRVARHLQERELRRRSPLPGTSSPPPPPPPCPPPHHHAHAHSSPIGDMNSVGLPDVSEIATAQFRQLSVKEEWPAPPPREPSPDELGEDEQRRIQEIQDQELARLLQQQEERLSGEGLDQLDRDRLMAIEAQDKELARMLQERERAKARRARERAKQRALLKKQQEAQEGELDPPQSPVGTEEVNHRHRHRYPDPEAIEVLNPASEDSPSPTSPLTNIAMAIDPTYSPQHNHHRHHTSSPHEEYDEFEDGPAPPYMPIQGQRRTSSLEKKKKKHSKEGCKQQ